MPEPSGEPESRFYSSARLKLHYVVWGDESKPGLILVHGSQDHARSWDFVAQGLLDRFCVYACDLRGHGDSDWTNGTAYLLGDHVLDLARMVEALGRDQVDLVGHSLGGRICLDYAAAEPQRVRRIVAIEGFGRYPYQTPPSDRLRRYVQDMAEAEDRRPRVYSSIESALMRMRESNPNLSPEMARHFTRHAVRPLPEGGYVWKFDNLTYVPPAQEWGLEETRAIWSRVRAPVLHIGSAGNWRNYAPRDLLNAALADVHIEVVTGAGHWVHHDQLERFLQLTREFLA